MEKGTFKTILMVFGVFATLFAFLYQNFETQEEADQVTSDLTYRVFMLESRLDELEKIKN